MITQSTHNRVDNWSRVHRWFRSRGRSFSLEGRFRCPRGVEVEYENGEPPPKPPQILDVFDAWAVELAWRMLERKHRWLLKFHYHSPPTMTHEKACRLMKRMRPAVYVHVGRWDREREAALLSLQASLEQLRHGRSLIGTVAIPLDTAITVDYNLELAMLAD